MGLRDPQNLTPSPVPAASNYSKHSPAFTCAQTPCGAWDPAGCCCSKTRKASADALPVLSCIGSPGGGRTGKAGEHLQSSANVSNVGICHILQAAGWHGAQEEVRESRAGSGSCFSRQEMLTKRPLVISVAISNRLEQGLGGSALPRQGLEEQILLNSTDRRRKRDQHPESCCLENTQSCSWVWAKGQLRVGGGHRVKPWVSLLSQQPHNMGQR